MGKIADLSDFDKSQNMMAGSKHLWKGKTCGMLRVSCAECQPNVVSGVKTLNRWQGVGLPWLIDVRGERKLSCLLQKGFVPQIPGNFNAVDESSVMTNLHWTLLNMGLHSHSLLQVPLITLDSTYNEYMSVETRLWTSRRKSLGPTIPLFCCTMWMFEYTCIVYLGKC